MTVLLRHGRRVRCLIDDGFVTVGLEGVVTGIVHPGYAGAREHMVRINWDNDTTSRLPVAAVEVIEEVAA